MNLVHAGPAWICALAGGLVALVLLAKGSFPVVAHIFNLLALALLGYIGVVALSHPHRLSVVMRTLVPHLHLT